MKDEDKNWGGAWIKTEMLFQIVNILEKNNIIF